VFVTPPVSEKDLMERADALAGKTLQQIANETESTVPAGLNNAKGWIGELIEISLGATAASRPEPDFQIIGVELKTIPLDINGKPKESTFICNTQLTGNINLAWEDSAVRHKLSRVLWVPIEASSDIPLALRRVGSAVLWSPDTNQESQLRADWEELMEIICLGELDRLSSHIGVHLQIRPKAANARSLSTGLSKSGEIIQTLPRGFYLRASFTAEILSQ
jgi:DNA mismatch repair protein MutH